MSGSGFAVHDHGRIAGNDRTVAVYRAARLVTHAGNADAFDIAVRRRFDDDAAVRCFIAESN
jgi:hypothetical protein